MKLTTRIAYAIFPWYTWVNLRQELRFTRMRWANVVLPNRRRTIRRLRKLRGLRVHLGCGKRILPNWLNVDGLPAPGVDLLWDLRYPLPLETNSVAAIFSEHVLEHLYKGEGIALLQECYRILEPGGRMRIGVPDAELYLRAYSSGDPTFFKQTEYLGGGGDRLEHPIEVVNRMFRMYGHHQYAWDFTHLASELSQIGFQEISRCSSGESGSQDLCLDDPAHSFETLYVEMRKPALPAAK
jgi:predicted SAM-dependent methyltransferase